MVALNFEFRTGNGLSAIPISGAWVERLLPGDLLFVLDILF
jgi:hypothetical protein